MRSSSAEEAARIAGLDPATLVAALTPREERPVQSVPTAPVMRMGRRRTYVPLSEAELDQLSSVFTVGARARVPGSLILNGLLAHVIDGVPYEQLHEDLACRSRLRRSARKGEFNRIILPFVEANAASFTAQHLEGFRRLAKLEDELRRRNGWS